MSRGTSILRTEFVELDMHFAEKVVVVRRTSVPFARVADMDSTVDAMARALPEGRRKGYSVLIDTRLAPVRPDPSLEPAFLRYRNEVERGFDRAVVVVTTVIGKIRSERLAQTAQLDLTIVGSIDDAWSILQAPEGN